MRFGDRKEAGKLLAKELAQYKGKKAIVLAIPRGGVVIGRVVADELNLPLDVIVTKKVTPPDNEEYAIGAVGETEVVIDEFAMREAGVRREDIEQQIMEKQLEVGKRYAKFRGSASPPMLKDRIAIIVDDGIATGHTMKAAIAVARHSGALKVVAAIPVGPVDGVQELRKLADEVVCLSEEPVFFAVGEFYDSFPQTEDDEVVKLLGRR